jgi:HEPN domain-containing protein
MGNPNAAKTVAQLMLESAHQDLTACALLATAAGIKDAVVGFHARQAIEKSLKAVLSFRAVEFRRTNALDVVTRVIAWAEVQITPQPKI